MITFSSDPKSLGRASLARKISLRKVLRVAVVAVLLVAGLGLAHLGAQTPEATPQASVEQSVAPAPPEGTTLLEAEPLPPNTGVPTPPTNAVPDPSPPSPPEPTPPLRTGDVAFPTPAARNDSEPLVAIGRPVGRTDYGAEGNRRAAQLRSMPPERFTFDRALLRDVLRFLAEAAAIPFVSIPESSPQAQQLVTFRMTASPFAALESLARQYGIMIEHVDGVWSMRLPNTKQLRQERLQRILKKEEDNELVGVMYQLRHESLDRVDFRTDVVNPQRQADARLEGFSGSSPSLPLQNSQKVFVRSVPRLVNDIRSIVGLPPLKVDLDGNIKEDETAAGGAIVDVDRLRSAAEMALDAESSEATAGKPGEATVSSRQPEALREGRGALTQPDTVTPLYVPPERPQVVYNSDLNFIWVVATRKQHKWVAEYLSKVDKPQDLIAIEVKFLETKKNPQLEVGINWQDTFGTGLTVGGRASVGGEDIGSIDFARGQQNGRNTGDLSLTVDDNGQPTFRNRQTLNDPLQPGRTVDNSFAQSSVSGSIPYSAVLSLDQFSFTLQAFMQDRDTSVVQYPRVLTLNNREVAITSSENTPLNTGTSDVGSNQGGTTQTVGALGYLPTGTQINILPKVVNANQIAMTVAITVSSIVGFESLNLGTGLNRYPITSERVFNASLQVDSGYTLAVGGLEKVDDRDVVGGIPVLQDIPGLGYLFKNKNKTRNKVNLIIFITPYLIGDPSRTPGISETPKSILPVRPGVPPDAPTFTPDGRLSGGEAAVQNAFAWLEYQLDYFRQINLEAMMSNDSIRKLRDVIGVARALLSDLQLAAGEPPYDFETQAGREAIRAEELLTDLNRVLAVAQDNLM